MTSPPALVPIRACDMVRHGAVRLQGLPSFPTPDTNVRCCAIEADAHNATNRKGPIANRVLVIATSSRTNCRSVPGRLADEGAVPSFADLRDCFSLRERLPHQI